MQRQRPHGQAAMVLWQPRGTVWSQRTWVHWPQSHPWGENRAVSEGGCWEVPQSREHGPGLSHNARESRPLFRILDVTHSQAGATAHGKDLAENPRAVQPAPLWGAWGLRGQDPRLMPLSQTLIHAPAPASPLTRGGFGGQTGHSFRAAVHLTVDTAGARICRVDSPFLKAQRGGRPGGLTVHLRARPGGSRRPPASVQEAPATSTGNTQVAVT